MIMIISCLHLQPCLHAQFWTFKRSPEQSDMCMHVCEEGGGGNTLRTPCMHIAYHRAARAVYNQQHGVLMSA